MVKCWTTIGEARDALQTYRPPRRIRLTERYGVAPNAGVEDVRSSWLTSGADVACDADWRSALKRSRYRDIPAVIEHVRRESSGHRSGSPSVLAFHQPSNVRRTVTKDRKS